MGLKGGNYFSLLVENKDESSDFRRMGVGESLHA